MSGAGNDFMVIDARNRTLDFPALAVKLCGKTGADGFMAVDHSSVADFRLHFYNSDGTRGEMCGNGARCICKFAYDHGIAGPQTTVQTDAGIVPGWRLEKELYRVKLNNPGVLDLDRLDHTAYVELGQPGVPHGVKEIPDLSFEAQEPLREEAVFLRWHPAFPKGANINFYRWLDDTTVRVLTFERGVEDYTLACGTGCGSTAAVLWVQGKLPGGKLTAMNQGGTLEVTVEGDEQQISAIYLEGPATVLKHYDL